MPITQTREPQPLTRKERRTRILLVAGSVLLLVLAVIQLTPAALFPARKTSTVWGMFVGFAAASAYFTWRQRPED